MSYINNMFADLGDDRVTKSGVCFFLKLPGKNPFEFVARACACNLIPDHRMITFNLFSILQIKFLLQC